MNVGVWSGWQVSAGEVVMTFAGTPESERLTGKEILVLENGTTEVQWELERRK
jgi:hypothetical protein